MECQRKIPKVSVVTICRNEEHCIRATIDSVLEQTYKNIEYVIKDGGSSDRTVDIIKETAALVGADSSPCVGLTLVWESGKDIGGLYGGMNAGLSKCTGEYVLFCNAGDSLASHNVIEKMVLEAERNDLPDFVFGDSLSTCGGKVRVRSAHGPGFIKFGMPASHEAIMYRLSVIRSKNLAYDITYRIAADYKFTYQFVMLMKSFVYVPIPVVAFSDGGVSTANKMKGLMESSRVRREVPRTSLMERVGIVIIQGFVIFAATYLAPVYRMIRLRKVR